MFQFKVPPEETLFCWLRSVDINAPAYWSVFPFLPGNQKNLEIAFKPALASKPLITGYLMKTLSDYGLLPRNTSGLKAESWCYISAVVPSPPFVGNYFPFPAFSQYHCPPSNVHLLFQIFINIKNQYLRELEIREIWKLSHFEISLLTMTSIFILGCQIIESK